MKSDQINIKRTLEMVKKREITPDDGLKLIQKLKQDLGGNNVIMETQEEPEGVLFYHYDWELMVEEYRNTENNLPAKILVFDNEEKTSVTLRESIKNVGGQVILVTPGENFEKLDNWNYKLNPSNYNDYKKLDAELKKNSFVPEKIIHKWCTEDFRADEDSFKLQIDKGFKSVFNICKSLIEGKSAVKTNLVYMFQSFEGKVEPQYASVSALLKSVNMENPGITFKTVEVSLQHGKEVTDAFTVENIVFNEVTSNDYGIEIRYFEGKKYTRVLKEVVNKSDDVKEFSVKDKGVYLITGGAGGLGLLFAEKLAQKPGVKLILTGRSDLGSEREERIKQIQKNGTEVIYIKSDISKKSEVEHLIVNIKKRFNAINGIIHAAGTVRDSFVLKKTSKEIDEVFSTKIYGTVLLRMATIEEPLDFFAMFSSGAAISGNIGQSDYAFANSFMNAYAEKIAKEVNNVKIVSIAWPLWKDGGMKISGDETNFTEKMGLRPMLSSQGLETWDTIMRLKHPYCVVVCGIKQKIRGFLKKNIATDNKKEIQGNTKVDTQLLTEKTESYFRDVFSKMLKLPASKIEKDTSFEEYGVDSILVNQFNSNMEKVFTSLPKTLLFECQTLKELVDYFVNNKSKEMIEILGLKRVKPLLGKSDIIAEKKSGIAPDFSKWRELESFKDRKYEDKGNKYEYTRKESHDSEIAIIGVSGRYPGARNIDEFWENLKNGVDSITEVPYERWDVSEYYDPDPEKAKEGKMYCKWGGFLDDVDKFDPLFFNISPREAEKMDPQERLFLEHAWAAIEDAGYTRKKLREHSNKENSGNIGVFAAVTSYTYTMLGPAEWAKGNMIVPNSNPWTIANRVSYVFNFSGPSIPVDTACSSGLSAIHLACESLRREECHTAIAGGVNLYLHPSKYAGMCQIHMLSPRGRCHSFGSKADGFVPGEGVGAFVLKPLKQALLDGDNIYAVIKGTSINHGGTTNGYTVPNPNAQAKLILDALERSRIDPRTISNIEAHGTGTSLGDPIEIAGLTKAFRKYTNDKNFCSISSVKSNIGHLESAAGTAGLTKMLLQLKYKKLVPTLHSEELNSNIDFENSPFYVQYKFEDWEQPVIEGKPFPRRAGISSFGAGGANAHVILEEYEAEKSITGKSAYGSQIFVLSARDGERLKEYAALLAGYIEKRFFRKTIEQLDEKLLLEYLEKGLKNIASNVLSTNEDNFDNTDEILELLGPFEIVNFIGKVNGKYGVALSPIDITLHNTLKSFAWFFLNEYKDNLIKFYPNAKRKVEELPENMEESLSEIAYTLATGREAMPERLAIVASNVQELFKKLIQFCKGFTEFEGVYFNNLKLNKGQKDLLVDGKAGEEFLKIIIKEGEIKKLAQLWTLGVEINWNLLYSNQNPRRIPLPTYPFARERYWVHISEKPVISGNKGALIQKIHPLIDSNISNFDGLQYKTIFTGEGNTLKKYKVLGQRLLPGGACLEMAVAAAQVAGGRRVCRVSNMEFACPVIVAGTNNEFKISLNSHDDAAEFEITGEAENNKRVVYFRGMAFYEENQKTSERVIDIDKIKLLCENRTEGARCKELIESMGIEYDRGFIAVEEILTGKTQVLSSISISEEFRQEINNYTLHPAVVEGILQTLTVITAKKYDSSKMPYLFSSVKEVIINSPPIEDKYYVLIEMPFDVEASTEDVVRFDVKLLEQSGRILVSMNGIELHKAALISNSDQTQPEQKIIKNQEKTTLKILEKAWKESAANTRGLNNISGAMVVLANNETMNFAVKILENTTVKTIIVKKTDTFVRVSDKEYQMDFSNGEAGIRTANQILDRDETITGFIDISDIYLKPVEIRQNSMGRITLLQRLIKGTKANVFNILHITKGLQSFAENNVTLAGAEFAGIVKMLGAEYGKVVSKIVDVDIPIDSAVHLTDIIDVELSAPEKANEVCYRNGKRYVPYLRNLNNCDKKECTGFIPSKDKVVVITGGTRGIGLELARDMVSKGCTKFVLMGLNPFPNRKEWKKLLSNKGTEDNIVSRIKAIMELENQGAGIELYTGSLNNEKDLIKFFDRVRRTIGGISCVFHCAGMVIDDNPAFINKKISDMKKVFEPKIEGLETLHKVFAEDKLDNFVLFSSISATSPLLAAGFSDYAAANSYMDYFALYQHNKGNTYYKSIAWPSWKKAGKGEIKSPIYLKMGLTAHSTEDGLSMLYSALSYKNSPCIIPCMVELDVFKDDMLLSAKIAVNNQLQLKKPSFVEGKIVQVNKDTGEGSLKKLRNILSDELKIPENKLEEDTSFGDYGVDSIMLAEIVKKIEQWIGKKLDPAIILEYPTIKELNKYLCENIIENESIDSYDSNSQIQGLELLGKAKASNASSQAVKSQLFEIFSKELKISIERMDENTAFGDYGVDSIMLAEIVKKIEEWLEIKIDPSILLEHQNIKELTNYLEKNFGENNSFQSNIETKSVADSNQTSKVSSIAFTGGYPKNISPMNRSSKAAYKTNVKPSASNCDKIAVIGVACNFPGAKDKESFWEKLQAGVSSIVEIPATRWDKERYYSQKYEKGKSISKWGGFIEDIEYFDPGYFNLSEEDAPYIDPLIRQFLEVSVQTFRDAGYDKKGLWNRKVGVFVGSRAGTFGSNLRKVTKSSIIGIGQNFIGAHVSHFFNLKGPNIVVDTACSSSLVSLHMACQSLLTSDCEIALAGGVDILLDEKTYILLSESKALSPDGKCHTFDLKANGFVPGEGCGAVLLKRLENAIHDGDRIYAVIDATAVNNDGHTMGITTPNPEAQAEVIQSALIKGNINPSTISYIEAHGTGTMIGDPIELKALTKIFRQSTDERQFCSVGSVKTNIGHLASAAGIASFIKVVLSIENRKIPPTLNCDNPNPRFEFASSPFYPNIELRDWKPRGKLLRAGISSFGFGGTNAHIIVSECDPAVLVNYEARMHSIPPVEFNRRRYWLDNRLIWEEQNDNLEQKGLNSVKKNVSRDTLLELELESEDTQFLDFLK